MLTRIAYQALGAADKLPSPISQEGPETRAEAASPEPVPPPRPRMKVTARRQSLVQEEEETEEEEEVPLIVPERRKSKESKKSEELRTKHRQDHATLQARLEKEKELKGQEKLQEKGADLAKEFVERQQGRKRFLEYYQQILNEHDRIMEEKKKARFDPEVQEKTTAAAETQKA